MKRWWTMIVTMVAVMLVIKSAMSDPQTESVLVEGCSQYNGSNIFEFFRNFNSTLADIRRDISVNKTHWATQQQARSTNPVYTMFQCRNYLSTEDCLACFDKAAVDIRAYCNFANGARVGYDGCFLRYESNGFYDTGTALGNTGKCNNDTVSNGTASAFSTAAQELLTNLKIATSKIQGYYAATTKQVLGSNTTIYAVAQCAESLSPSTCQSCMDVAYENIKSCPPRSGARAVDAGCFMRYSNKPFFATNQTINIKGYLRDGKSNDTKAIIGSVAGGVGLILLVLALFIWYQLTVKKKVAQRGHILGSTELQGPVTYNYKELKSATKNFSEEYKLGEGGSGDVYKLSSNMAPSKKTKSAPNQTSKNLLKAIRKHRSASEVGKMKSTKTTTPVSIPSPEKVKKKPVSKKLQNELSKKRKRVEEPVKVTKEGLRLLKRAPVSMHRIVRRKIQGIKLVVNFNSKGVPYGAAATEMQSYIGVLARTKVPISLKSWKEVSKETLKKIWNCVQIAFDVPPEAKQVILKSAGNKWREFKSKLTTHYILPYRQQRHLIKTPPADYSFIEQRHWDIFLASRLTDDFIAVHDKQKKVREQNIYPHNMSRRGYANLEEEMSQGDPSLEIDRSDAWIRARQDKDGNFKSSEVETIAVNIEKMKRQVLDGEVTEEGSDDVMSKVLGKSDQKAGKVRGGGTLVKPSVYFHLPRQTRKLGKSIDDKIQEGLQKFMSEAENRIARERDAYWEKKFEDLKSSLLGQNTNGDGSPNIGSQQGSCSKDACAHMKAVELDGVKKKLDLVEDDILKKKDKNVENEVKTDEIKTAENEVETDKDEVKTDEVKTAENQMKTGEDQVKTDEDQDIGNIIVELVENQDEDMANNIVKTNEVRTVDTVELVSENKLKVVNNNCGVGSATTNWCSEWKLTIESPTNVVAYGTIDNITTVLHGKPVGEDNSRVCITRVVQENEKIPYPPEDDVVTVGQAVGTYIAWPKNWIHPTKNGGAAETPKKSNQVVKKKFKRVKDCVKEKQYVIDVDVDGYPAELKQLWLWAKETLKDGRAHSFQLCKDAFGSTTKHVIFLSDIHALCSGGEISGSTICYYINILGGFLKRHKMTEMVSFVDPILFGGSGCGTPVDRSRAISARFKNAKAGQFFLLPLHHQNHWTLTAVNPEAQVVFHMDPLKRRIADEEWIEVVDNAINMYKDNAKKYKKKKIMWENLAGVPVQIGSTDCGLYVMRYIREICFDKERQFATKWLKRSNLTYDTTELNETRVSWAKYFMKKEVHQ